MSRVAVGASLVLLLCLALVATAPARLLGALLPDQQIVMQGFGGTLWRGRAGRCLLRAGGGWLHLGSLQWSLSPVSLLWLSPRVTLESEWGAQVIAGEAVWRGEGDVDLHRFRASVDADLLRQFAPVALSGEFSAELQELSLRDGLPVRGAGRLLWRNAGWQGPEGPLPLGSYAVDFRQAPGEALEGQVVTLQGPVKASGRIELRGGEYTVDILVTGQRSLDPRLRQALSLIARPVAQGFRIEFEGALAAFATPG
jgi:general secretion pathway protein N